MQLLHPIQAIFDANDATPAQHLRDTLVCEFEHHQPELVATLQRDWQETVAFFKVLQHFPDW